MPNDPSNGWQSEDRPEPFTRLSIALCPDDDGTRPVNPLWAFSDIGFWSPAINFSQFPIPMGQTTVVEVAVNNFGTIDSNSAWMDTACCMYIGTQPQAMTILNSYILLPVIPAGGGIVKKVNWTPQEDSEIHACFFARVTDGYSLTHWGSRCLKWSPYINPQAACKNSILIKVENDDLPIMTWMPLKNFFDVDIRVKLLVTEMNSRFAFRNPDDRFPLPFEITRSELAAIRGSAGSGEDAADGAYRPETINRDRRGMVIPPIALNRLWPREDINSRHIHDRYGFDVDDRLRLPPGAGRESRGNCPVETQIDELKICSYQKITLKPGESRMLKLVIPSEELPPRGRRRKFRIDCQVGSEKPAQQVVCFSR